MASGTMWLLLIKDEQKPLRLRMRTVFTVLLLALLALVLGLTGAVTGVRLLAANTDLRRELQDLAKDNVSGEEELTVLQQHIADLEARYAAPQPLEAAPETAPDEASPEETPNPDLAPQGPPVDLPALFAHVDLGVMAVDNLVLSRQGERELRVTFDLTNGSGARQSGDGKVLLITRDGREAEAVISGNDLAFEIRNFKKVAATATLPEGMTWEQVHAVALSLNDQDGRTLLRIVRALGAP